MKKFYTMIGRLLSDEGGLAASYALHVLTSSAPQEASYDLLEAVASFGGERRRNPGVLL